MYAALARLYLESSANTSAMHRKAMCSLYASAASMRAGLAQLTLHSLFYASPTLVSGNASGFLCLRLSLTHPPLTELRDSRRRACRAAKSRGWRGSSSCKASGVTPRVLPEGQRNPQGERQDSANQQCQLDPPGATCGPGTSHDRRTSAVRCLSEAASPSVPW